MVHFGVVGMVARAVQNISIVGELASCCELVALGVVEIRQGFFQSDGGKRNDAAFVHYPSVIQADSLARAGPLTRTGYSFRRKRLLSEWPLPGCNSVGPCRLQSPGTERLEAAQALRPGSLVS